MNGEFFLITKDVACRKKMCKIDLFHQNKHDYQFFLKYAVSSNISGLLSGAVKVALLRAMNIQCAFFDDYFK